MKKIFALILLVLCVRLLPYLIARLDTPAREEAVPTETAAQIPAEATAETEPAPPETTQPGNVVEEKQLYFESGYETEASRLEVFGCRMFTLDNGYTRFEIDYQTADGLYPIAFAYVGEDHHPAFWFEPRIPTTSHRDTLVFEMETGVLNQSNGPDVHFQNRNYESVSFILIYLDQSAA